MELNLENSVPGFFAMTCLDTTLVIRAVLGFSGHILGILTYIMYDSAVQSQFLMASYSLSPHHRASTDRPLLRCLRSLPALGEEREERTLHHQVVVNHSCQVDTVSMER